MKIGMTGAGGTGKSTLAIMLAEALQLPLIPSPSRACFERRGVLTEDDQLKMSPEGKYLLQTDIFKAIDEQVTTIQEGVFERTHLDNFFYLLFRCHDVATEQEIREMESVTVKGLHSFNRVLYFPLYDWPPSTIGDGMRTTKYAGRFLMDRFIRDMLSRWKIPNICIDNTPPLTRLARVCQHLNAFR